jgi:hypothetical protein
MIQTRKLIDGREVLELDKAVTLEIYTKCPEKYMLIDMQTGEKYIGHTDPNAGSSHWKKVHTCQIST